MNNTLDLAQDLHAQGRLAEAESLYREVLRRQPNTVGALQGLGALAYQHGRVDEASEWFARGVAVQPDAPDFHANLGETLRLRGRFDEAAGHLRTALSLDARLPDAWNSLGLLLHGRRQYAEAEEAYRSALRLRPGFAAALINLGMTLHARGRSSDARESLGEALRIEPRNPAALANLGQVLQDMGDPALLDEAESLCRRAVAAAPHLPQAFNNLGNVLRLQGRFDEALDYYSRAVQLDPRRGEPRYNIGQILQKRGRYDDAARTFDEAHSFEPNPALYHFNYGYMWAERGDHVQAAGHYRLALRSDPDYVLAHHGLGMALLELGQTVEAEACLREALKLKPGHAGALAALARLNAERGDLDESCRLARSALASRPGQTDAYSQLAVNLRGRLPEDEVRRMQSLLRQPYLEDRERALLHFALASVMDARGSAPEAAALLQAANRLQAAAWAVRGEVHDPAAHSGLVDRLISTFTPEFLDPRRGWGDPDPRPVFVVGLPRSGTTLTEQILASHPDVHGVGELPDAERLFHGLPDRVGNPALGRFDALHALSPATAKAAARDYLARLDELAPPSARRVVDKMPDNVQLLGLIALLWPGAKVVVCHRDPRDIAVSCWKTGFATILWANDFDHIARRFADHERLLGHWRRCRPLAWFDLHYEDLVNDLETHARRLIEFVGLEWDPACLNSHSTRREVRTASLAQVREPVHARAVGRWKQYESSLQPLFEALDRHGVGAKRS